MITPQMGAIDHGLEKLRTSNADDLVSWMVGAQYFLKEDVQLVRGHTFYPDSPWALTSISQAQFWTEGGAFWEVGVPATAHRQEIVEARAAMDAGTAAQRVGW